MGEGKYQAATNMNSTALKSRLLSFLASWPVVCSAVSFVFLGTVYVMGNVVGADWNNLTPRQPAIEQSSAAKDTRHFAIIALKKLENQTLAAGAKSAK